jgi:multimeric flavodoxin WrbA
LKISVKVLGIAASPRKGGNSDFLLDRVLDGARYAGASVEKIVLNELDFRPCQECGGCARTGICVLRDGMSSVYRKVVDSDILVVASPVFFGNITAQLKAMIDRFHCAWISKNALKKKTALFRKRRKGIFLCAGAVKKRKYFERSKKMVRIFFNTAGADYSADLFCGGVEAKGAARAVRGISKKAFMLGESHVRRHKPR